jgi:hypothetical protein
MRSPALADDGDPESLRQYIEAQKLVLDYLKHLVTLDTACIVLMATLMEKFFQHPQWRWLVAATFMSFLGSALALSLSAFGVVRSVRSPAEVSEGLRQFTTWTFLTGLLGFMAGLVMLAAWGVRNWTL